MTTITKLDHAAVRILQKEAEAALNAVAAKYGMTLKPGNGRFSPDRLTVKFDFVAVAETGAPSDFARKATLVGLPGDCFGKKFNVGGTVYTVTEINLRRPKYPVGGAGPQGGRYKFTTEQVLAGLAA